MKRIINAIKRFAMEKKKAFTLIEVMGVLVIIGILTVILIPVINNTVKNNKEDLYNKQIESIRLATKNLASDNMYILPEEEGEEIYITLGQLRAMGYAEEKIINPKTKENFPDDLIVMVIKKDKEYDYEVIIDGGAVITSSGIIVSNPSEKYIRKSNTSSYIITAKTDKEIGEKKAEYYINVGKENIELLGEVKEDSEVKYKVEGNNGLYKLTVIGGEIEGSLYFNFKDLKDIEGKEVNVTDINNEINDVSKNKQIIVDNTAPVINFTTNGTGAWSKEVKTKIEVTDNNGNDALDSSTYKYIYSLSSSDTQELTNSYSLNEEVSQGSGDGEYYLIASACDKAGNCSKELSNKFLVDNTAPTCSWSGENSTWTRAAQTITVLGMDNHKMNSSKSVYTKTYNQSGIEIATDNLSYEIEDEAGNKVTCSKSVNVYYDKKGPELDGLKNNSNGNWTKNDFSVSYNVKDLGSGYDYCEYNYDYDAYGSCGGSSWCVDDGSYSSGTFTASFSAERNTNSNFRCYDKLGNVSNVISTPVKIDKTAPYVKSTQSCTPETNYTKCFQFTYADNFENNLTVYRAHCAKGSGTTVNYCNFATAKTRVEYFKNNNGAYYESNGITDNKARKHENIPSVASNTKWTNPMNLNTNFGSSVVIQFAIIVCDEAGNCSNTGVYEN